MPKALFLYVFSSKRDPKTGQLILVRPLNLTAATDPARLAETGFVPSITRPNVTFKAQFQYNKGDLTGRDLKVIQQSLDKELSMARIGKPYRTWLNAFNAVEKLRNNVVIRNMFLNQVGATANEAVSKYKELMTTGSIGGIKASADDVEMVTTDVPTVQTRVQNAATAVGDDAAFAKEEASQLSTAGEGVFVSNDAEGDELADLLGGITLKTVGGRRRRKTRHRSTRRRHTRR